MAEMTPLQSVAKRYIDFMPILVRVAAGEQLEFRKPGACRWLSQDACDTAIDLYQYDYRIKPSPQYRPFTQPEALAHIGRCFAIKHLPTFRWVIRGVSATGVLNTKVGIAAAYSDNTFGYLADCCVFDDGTPCGVQIES